MVDNIKDAAYKVLRDIQARLGRLEGDIATVKADTNEIKGRMTTAEHLLKHTDRFGRLENRFVLLEQWRQNFES